jgi:hypothetical protein
MSIKIFPVNPSLNHAAFVLNIDPTRFRAVKPFESHGFTQINADTRSFQVRHYNQPSTF